MKITRGRVGAHARQPHQCSIAPLWM